MFADAARVIYLDDFSFDAGDKFTYEDNFFENWLVDIRIEDIGELASQPSVYCVKGNGMPGANKDDEVEHTLNLLKAIARFDERATVCEIRTFANTLNTVRFNRHDINNRLQTELVK